MLSTATVSASLPTRSTSHRHSQHSSTSTAAAREDILRLIAECDATLKREPECLHTRAVRGHACMKAKLWDRAIADFGLILASRPDDVHGRFSRGMALFKSGHVEDAHTDFSRVLELNPHHVMARYARAGCYNTEGKFHHAIQDYTIALQHDEKEHDAVVGGRHGLRGWHQEAEKLVNEKLSGSDLVRQGRSGGSGDEHRRVERRATMAESSRRPKIEEDEEVRRASVTTRTQLSLTSTDNTTSATGKKPRKVVQVKLDLGGGVAVQAAKPQPSVPEAAYIDYEKRLSPRCESPRSNSRLRLECVRAPPSTSNPQPQPLHTETPTRRATQSSEPPLGSEGLTVNSSGRVQSPRVPEPRIQAQSQSMKPEEMHDVTPRQPARRAVRRVTIAL